MLSKGAWPKRNETKRNETNSLGLRSFRSILSSIPIISTIGLAGMLSTSCATGGSSEEVCEDCTGANLVWGCYGGLLATSTKYKGSVCVPNTWDELDVRIECNVEYGAPLWTCRSATLNPCENTAGSGTSANNSQSSCNDWDPVGEITFNTATSVYEINEGFVDYIVEDPMRLANCDAGRIKFISSANEFQVTGASSGIIL